MMGRGDEAGRGPKVPGLAARSLRRPRLVLGVWLSAVAILGVIGLGVEQRLTQSLFVLPDTETARAVDLSSRHFGENVFVPVLLEGPRPALERQGPRLVRVFAGQPGWRTLSAWDGGPSARALRPRPGAAMVVASVSGPYEQIFDDTARRVRELVADEIGAPVEARITGMPVIGNAIKSETYSSAREAERLAIPILFVVLLLVFRAPIAALFPALIGLGTVIAAPGAIALLTNLIDIDPLAISLASMMGLALGVDYSLLIVSRFREEAAAGLEPPAAARVAVGTAGRTIKFAGVALLLAMLVGVAVSPGDILVSAAVGTITATAIGLLSGLTAIPAGLVVFGHRIDWLRIGRSAAADSPAWVARVRAVLSHSGITALLVVLPLLLLTAPALALDTGPPDVSQLPAGNQARQDFERVAEVMGAGWAAPFEVVAVARRDPVTEPSRLRELEQWQRAVAGSPGVATVIGPGQLRRRVARQRTEIGESERALQRGRHALGRLARGIDDAREGVEQLVAAQRELTSRLDELGTGADEAASGGTDLELRLAAVAGGTELIRAAVDELAGGGERLIAALERVARGGGRIADGLGQIKRRIRYQVVTAADLLAFGLRQQEEQVKELRPRARQAEAELEAALAALDAMGPGKADPAYDAAYEAVSSAYEAVIGGDAPAGEVALPLDRELELAQSRLLNSADQAEAMAVGSRRLASLLGETQRAARELAAGLRRLDDGAGELADGTDQISAALTRLRDGVTRIGGGAEQLSAGLARLSEGSHALAHGVDGGAPRAEALVFGLGRASWGAARLRTRTSQLDRPLTRARALFESGYFVLAGIDLAPAAQRRRSELVLNSRSGGEAARILVIPDSGPNDAETSALRDELSRDTERLAKQLGARAAVGGTAAALAEYDAATSERLIWLILALAGASYLILIPVFGSLLLPALAVALNLLSVGAAFGALALLFQGDDSLLGGPGYVDAVSISAMYTVIFGLSLDYQVFLIARMREGWERLRDNDEAIVHGLERTGAVVTGAAAIMVAVFVAFALTDVAGTRQFGAGMVVAVLIDATLIRLLLLPAVMRIAGDRCWTGPRWLAR